MHVINQKYIACKALQQKVAIPIALIAKQALTKESHHGRAIYFLTEAKSLPVDAVADYLANGLGIKVQASNVPETEMRRMLSFSGVFCMPSGCAH